MSKESYRSKGGKIVGKDHTYKDRTVHEKKVGPGMYKITGTTTHKGEKSTYKKKW